MSWGDILTRGVLDQQLAFKTFVRLVGRSGLARLRFLLSHLLSSLTQEIEEVPVTRGTDGIAAWSGIKHTQPTMRRRQTRKNGQRRFKGEDGAVTLAETCEGDS
jgi:hypothetical protein